MDFTTLAKVTYNDQLILTTEQISEFYGCPTENIKKNFNSNKGRFIEGKHYFKLEGEALMTFKNIIAQSYSVNGNSVTQSYPVVGKNANVLYLWTKRGAARHAKMLSTEKAWEVFEDLEDNYFNAKEKIESTPKVEKEIVVETPPIAETPSTEFSPQTAISATKDITTIMQIMKQYWGMPHEMAKLNAILTIEKSYNINLDYLKDTIPFIDGNEKKLFSPTQIGALKGKSAQYVNKRLCTLGFQKKDFKGGYILTDRGKEYGKLVCYETNGHKYHQIKWDYCMVRLI